MDLSYTDHILRKRVIQNRYYLVLFLLWPFAAFITAIINYKERIARQVVYLFIVYYGLSYYIGDSHMDSFAYVLRFRENALLPFTDVFKIVGGLYSSETSVDIVEPLISFLVSRFTNNHAFLFAAYAALFGYFYLKSVNLLYKKYQSNPGYNTLILLVFFISTLTITTINGFRMWTAAWIYFLGAYHVVLNQDRKYLLLALGACLVHWSFLTANLLLIAYHFLGNRNFIYFPITLVSFVLPNLLMPVLNTLSVGGAMQARISGYTNEDYMLALEEASERAPWFVTLSRELIFYYLIFAMFYVTFMFKDLMREKIEKNLFSFLLLFLAFVNFGTSIPSFGVRFKIVFILFATLYLFMYFLKMHNKKINLLALIGLFPMALYIAVEFRIGSEVINSWIFSPVFGLPLFVPGLSLADLFF